MDRRFWPAAALVGLLLVLAACGPSTSSPSPSATSAAGGLAQYAPSGEAWIEAVDLGTNDEASFDPGQSGTSFPSGIERVVVWYRWQDGEVGKRVDNRWSHQGGVVLEQGEALEEPSGTSAWFLVSAEGGPLPDGDYQVELLEDGRVVSTIPFTVGAN